MDDNAADTGVSQGRRELLKKLGVAAGALAWATPIVQTITTSAASASQGNGYGHVGSKTYSTTTTTRPTTTTTRPTTTTTRPTTTTSTTRPTTTTSTTRPTTTTTSAGAATSKLTAEGSCREQWWDASGKTGAWVGAAEYTFTHNRHAYLTILVTKTTVGGATSTSTTSNFYVPANGSATFEVYDLAYNTPAKSTDIKTISFKVTSMQTYNDAWAEVTYAMTGPTVTASCSPTGGSTTTTTRPTTTTSTTRPTTTTSTSTTTTSTTRPTTTTSTTRPTTTTTRATTTTEAPTTTTTAGGGDCDTGSGSGAGGKSYEVQYDGKGAGSKTATTTRPTTTTTRATTTTTEAPIQSGAGCHDISHLDLIVRRGSSTNYGITWDPSDHTWKKHSGSQFHCLESLTWSQPPSSFNMSDFPQPTMVQGVSYRVAFPVDVTIVAAFSKCGLECKPALNQGGNTYRFDPWCDPSATTTTTRPTTTTTSTTRPTTTTTSTTRPTTTTSTTRPTTTTSTTRPTSTTSTTRPTSTTSTTRPTSTTTLPGGGGDDCEGSPQPGKDISHMDWILCRGGKAGQKTAACTDRFGVQYDFGAGWGAHPSGPVTSQHCLAGLSWRVPDGTFSFAGFGAAVSLGGGSYRITLPADVTVFEAYSKCGQICRRATNLGGNTWRFDPC